MKKKELCFADIKVGNDLPSLVKRPTNIQLFRYSAVTWNSHRIHYDKEYALHEGYPDVLVQAELHGAFLIQLVTDWIGEEGNLTKFSWINRAVAIPGDTLTCKGKIVSKYIKEGKYYIECELWEENQKGEMCARGSATAILLSS